MTLLQELTQLKGAMKCGGKQERAWRALVRYTPRRKVVGEKAPSAYHRGLVWSARTVREGQ
ncbi:hypothetical protein [Caudoviricetes sp.]|nr:hypothetical protein [Caudoviricetes sp.]